MGISWDMGDTALTISNPAYGLYRLFGGKSWTSSDEERPTGTLHDITKTDAYKALLLQQQAMEARGMAAETRRQQALSALQAMRTVPASGYTPIAVNVPSFSLGRTW